MESDHGLEKILGVGLELEFKSMEPDWIQTPKKVTPLISGTFLLSAHHILQVIFFGETIPESPLQVSFLFHPKVVGGIQVSFSKKKITHNRWWGNNRKVPKAVEVHV